MRSRIAAATSIVLVVALVVVSSYADGGPAFTSDRVGTRVSEPGLHVHPVDGTIYVDGPRGVGAHSELHRWVPDASDPDGGDWEQIRFSRPFDRLPGGGDSDVALRGDRIYFIDLWLGSNSLSVSEDRGATWTFGSPITSLPASDRQWIALGPQDPATGKDTVYILYAQLPLQVMLARSPDGGVTWEHIPVPTLLGDQRAFTSQLVSDGNKSLAFASEDGGTLRVLTSKDGGDTWNVTGVAKDVASNITGIAMDGENIYVTWTNARNHGVYMSVSTDGGDTFSFQQRVSGINTTNVFPWIAARDGKVAIAYYGADTGAPKDPNDVSSSTQWYTRYVESLDNGTTWSTPVNVEVGPIKKGIICTRGLACDEGRELGDFLSVEIDLQGNTLIAHGGDVNGGVRLSRQIG